MESGKNIKKIILWLGALFFALFLVIYVFVKLPGFVKNREKEVKESHEIAITIPEGLNFRQIGDLLEKNGLFTKSDFIAVAQQEEGFLFPDTYRFYKDAKPADIISKMEENFNKKITQDILDKIGAQKKSLKDIIIMASILEEEVKSTEDRKIVSGILWKRISLGMGLNVDAALTYVLGKTSAELTDKDLKYDTPYNTYRYRGLPPTPISNPGLDTIFAALNPTISKYFYYLTDKKGNAHYAVTLEEHSLNKFKYLR
ncbi:MAG: endolytic transglycosylase MltG [bacterium]|nr:endolytic transglycosylase MltG [bacterium]